MKFVLPILAMLFSIVSVFAQDIAYEGGETTYAATSSDAATGLVAGADSLATVIPTTLPMTLSFTNVSHCNKVNDLALCVQFAGNTGPWSSPYWVNYPMNHQNTVSGTVSVKNIAGKMVVTVSTWNAGTNSMSLSTCYFLAPFPATNPVTKVRFATSTPSGAGLKLDGGGVYVLE